MNDMRKVMHAAPIRKQTNNSLGRLPAVPPTLECDICRTGIHSEPVRLVDIGRFVLMAIMN